MYKLSNNGIKRLSDGANIPINEGNRDYQEYLKWLNDGNVPEPEFTEEEVTKTKKAEAISLITKRHIEKQSAPIIIELLPYHAESAVNFLFTYTKDDKDNLSKIQLKEYSLDSWNSLMADLIAIGLVQEALELPIEAVAFAKLVKSDGGSYAGFLPSTELSKISDTVERLEIINFAKKTKYLQDLEIASKISVKEIQNVIDSISY